MFNGLYSYEAVMLVMGGAYFVVLATLLVFQIVRGRAYRGLLVFFLIPIAMMGYPGVKSIHLLGLTLDVENTTQQLQSR